jgi:predicted DNA-binding transcriptional regulator YafY
MPVADAPTTSQRLLSLLGLLQSQRDWSARVLADRLGVSERTVRRDIERLRELDYAIAATRGPDGGYRLRAGSELPPLLFDDEQAVALAVSLRTAATLGAGIEEAADRALRLVAGLMPARLAHRLESVEAMAGVRSGGAEGTVDPEALLRLGQAIRDEVEVRFDYDGSSSGDSDGRAPRPVRQVEPHHLVVQNGRWYLIGFSPEHDDWRIHRVDRMRLRSHTGHRFTRRTLPGGDAARFLSARFKGSTGADAWPCVGEATLGAPLVSVAPFVGDGRAEAVDAERTRVHLGAWSWAGLAASLLRFDADLGDVEPAELREAFAVAGERARAAGG